MSAYLAELIGTAILILLGQGVVANAVLSHTKSGDTKDSTWILITIGWGMAVFVAVFCVAEVSGAHINPAVTIALAAAGSFPWADVPGYIGAQMVGAFLGAILAWLFYHQHYKATEDPNVKLGTFCTSPSIRSVPSNFFCEVVGTFMLVFPIFRMVEPSLVVENGDLAMLESARIGLGSLGALPVGLLVFAIGMSLGGTTGYAINPARDLGPRIAHAILPIPGKGDSDWGYSWIPVLAPILGGIAGAMAYKALGVLEPWALQ